jgi:hypothetical protein
MPEEYKEEETTAILYIEGDYYSFLLCDEDRNLLGTIPLGNTEGVS